ICWFQFLSQASRLSPTDSMADTYRYTWIRAERQVAIISLHSLPGRRQVSHRLVVSMSDHRRIVSVYRRHRPSERCSLVASTVSINHGLVRIQICAQIETGGGVL